MFVNLPDQAWPSVVDADATDGRVSDLLGGIVVRVGLTDEFGLYVREDSRHMPLNAPASYLASLITRHLMPICGPAVLVGLDTVATAYEVDLSGAKPDVSKVSNVSRVSPFGGEMAALHLRVAEDAMYAKLGKDSQISDKGQVLCQEHLAELIRFVLHMLDDQRDKLPEDWPDERFERVGRDTAPIEDPHFLI
jgi:hypothetical protein